MRSGFILGPPKQYEVWVKTGLGRLQRYGKYNYFHTAMCAVERLTIDGRHGILRKPAKPPRDPDELKPKPMGERLRQTAFDLMRDQRMSLLR